MSSEPGIHHNVGPEPMRPEPMVPVPMGPVLLVRGSMGPVSMGTVFLHNTSENRSYRALAWSEKSPAGSPRRWAGPRGPAQRLGLPAGLFSDQARARYERFSDVLCKNTVPMDTGPMDPRTKSTGPMGTGTMGSGRMGSGPTLWWIPGSELMGSGRIGPRPRARAYGVPRKQSRY